MEAVRQRRCGREFSAHENSNCILSTGTKKIDSLHIACAVSVSADYFLTTDDEIIKRAALIPDIQIIDPIGFIKEVT